MSKEVINGFTHFVSKQDALSYAGIKGKIGKKTSLKKVWPDSGGGYWASTIAKIFITTYQDQLDLTMTKEERFAQLKEIGKSL